MRLRLQFGLNGTKKEVTWWNRVEDFPNILSYKGIKWEFVVYDKDPTKAVDYICTFVEIPSYDPNYTAWCRDLEDICATERDVCECGAESVSGAKTGHSTWCKKYQRY